MNDEHAPEPPGSDPHFGVIATVVAIALVALFVWQPWSGAPPPDRAIPMPPASALRSPVVR